MTNRTSTRRALLSSVMALLLCCTMLIGTTFAWFTDTASTNVNTIQAGTLDIALEDIDGNSLEGQSLSWQKAEGHENETVLWEPGCTYNLQPIVIKNNGNLALKYKVVITGIDGNAKLNEVIDWTITKDDFDPALCDADSNASINSEYALLPNEYDVLYISGHMQESAGNAYQGLSIDGISITVYATQYTYESDSNNNRYDANATYDIPWDGVTKTEVTKSNDGKYHITNAAQLMWMMEQSQNTALSSIYYGDQIVLESNIDLGGATITGFGNANVIFGGSFDGQGYTISNFNIDNAPETLNTTYFAGLFNYYSYGTLENLTVKNATVNGDQMVGALIGNIDNNATVKNCSVEDCTVIGYRKVGGAIGYGSNATATNISVKNTTVYCAVAEQSHDQNQWGEVIGYVGGGLTITDHSNENVTVVTGASYVSNGVMQQGNTYYIYNAQGLQWFANQVNENYNGFNAYTIKLTADIDLKNAEWYPIGQNENLGGHMQEFFGIFDGNGHTIKNLKIKSHTPTEIRTTSTNFNGEESIGYGVGFFGWLSGAVKNVTFENVKVTGYHNVGVVAGYFQHTGSSDIIENCTVKNCTVVATHADNTFCGDKVGGIVGMNGAPGTIKDCHVEDTTITAGRDAGQVVGCTQIGTSVENCTATNVTVTADSSCTDDDAGKNIKIDIIGRDLRH